MKKRIIGVVIGLVILISFGFVIASMTINNNGAYGVEVNVEKGWNIVAGIIPEDGILSDSEVKLSDIKAVWYYSPIQKKYLQVYPNMDEENLEKDNDDFVLSNAMWVYSDKQGLLKYSTHVDYRYFVEDIEYSLENRKLYSGWNFVTITSEIVEKNFNDIMGSCNIQKSYIWDFQEQEWIDYRVDINELDAWMTGLGWIAKVSSDCNFGSSSDSLTTPPSLPGGSDSDLIIEQDFGTFLFNTRLGQSYIEREYTSFPLSKMVVGDAAKYGYQNDVNAIVIEFSGNNEDNINDILTAYDTNFNIESLSPPAYPVMYKLSLTNNIENQIGLWYSNQYIVIIHGDNIFIDGSDQEQIMEDYLTKYPSTMTGTS